MTALRWLSPLVLDALQLDIARAHGGAFGRRDSDALTRSLAAPEEYLQAHPFATLKQLAAVYAWEIADSHPYRSGNRALALLAMLTFIESNGGGPAKDVATLAKLLSPFHELPTLETLCNSA